MLKLYQCMRLSEAQKEALAATWRSWCDTRAALDVDLSRALLPFANSVRNVLLLLNGPPQCAAAQHGFTIDRGGAAEVAPPGMHAPSGHRTNVCICDRCAADMSERLLGIVGESIVSAQTAVRRMREVHQHEAATAVALLRALCMPGVLLSGVQLTRQAPLVLRRGVHMDWLWLCKTAAEELSRVEVFRAMRSSCGPV